MDRPVAVVTGVGPGTGSAIVRRLAAGGYAVAMLARSRGRLAALEKDVPHAKAYACDVSDEAEIEASLAAVRRDMGSPSVLVHNAVGGAFGDFLRRRRPKSLEPELPGQHDGAAASRAATAPAMAARGGGALIVTGNTSALRGRANFAGFAPTKAAQRILAEVDRAAHVGPEGVHVAYLVIDAVIDLAWTRSASPTGRTISSSGPRRSPTEVWHLAHQERSAWSFNVEIRPFGETW